MATTIKLVQGNTAPPIDLTLDRDGSVIDLTGCTVSLIISQNNAITNAGHQSCTITSPATAGKIRYLPQAADFATGSAVADVKITYSDTTVEILYEQAKFRVRSKLA